MQERILIIRLGALGDLVLCFQAFQSIRDAHPNAEIAILTMPAFADFAKQMPWFNRVIVDSRAPGWRIDEWIKMARNVRDFAPTRVYDLQGKFRQTILYALLGGPKGPEWSGAAPGCSHPRLWPPVEGMHYTDFVAAQLRRADVKMAKEVHLSWLEAPLDKFRLPSKFVLLIPGCAPERSYKRWPPGRYSDLATKLRADDIYSVAIGTAHDSQVIHEIVEHTDDVINLCGQTSLGQVAALARRSDGVVGNDTGPTHLAAAVGAKTMALLSEHVNPAWSAPRGPQATWMQGDPLSGLSVEDVLRKFMPSAL